MTDNTINAIHQQLGLTPASSQTASKTLGQDDFLKLLVTQLQHQDPFDPQDNGEFIAQMAQFGTVEGIGKLQNSFSSLSQSLYANQALQASALVGRTVELPSRSAHLDSEQPLAGSVLFEADMSDVQIDIKNALGKTVKTLHLGDHPQGEQRFSWDGLDDEGNRLPVGEYAMNATGYFNGKRLACVTLTSANVNSVTLGRSGEQLRLTLQGIGDVNFNDVYRIT